jgi:hypothetical protein
MLLRYFFTFQRKMRFGIGIFFDRQLRNRLKFCIVKIIGTKENQNPAEKS